MNGVWRRFRRLIGDGGDDDAADSDARDLEADRPGSQSSGNTLEPPRVRSPRSRETSSLKAPSRKPRPVHRSATDTQVDSASEEESSTARLSRRSSVLNDFKSLFRRSSSFGGRKKQKGSDSDDVDDEDEEMDQKPTTESIMMKIRRNKEIIGKVKYQPWSMKRKKRTIKISRKALKKTEVKVSKWIQYRVEATRLLTQFLRWFGNFKIYLIPWESKIRRIESHFGTVVSSFFVFLRWILYVNVILTAIICFFIVIPEWLDDSRGHPNRLRRTKHIKEMPSTVFNHADEWKTVLDFGGYLQYSYIFYGYYSSDTVLIRGPFGVLRLPLAYFLVNLFVLGFSLFLILRKMAANARDSKIQGGKTDQYVFSWKVINGWDCSIGNPETGSSLYKANVIKLREAMAEFNQKMKVKFEWFLLFLRVVANLAIFSLLGLSGWLIWQCSQITVKDTIIKQNAVSIIVSFVTLVFPNIFELIGHMERYHPRFALRCHLGRVFFLYIVAYYSLFASLFFKLNSLQAQSMLYDEPPVQTQSPFNIVYNPSSSSNKTYYEIAPYASEKRARQIRETMKRKFRKKAAEVYTIETSDHRTISTTLPPEVTAAAPWTTVFPNYGPFGVGVYNPKAIVLSDLKSQKQIQKTVYESRPIGPSGDWAPGAPTTQGPVPLHYTNSPRIRGSWKYNRYKGDICWETIMGQEITKLVVTDLVMTVIIIMFIDFLRGLWVRYCNSWWCWNLEEQFPEYGEFKISENVLHLIKDQTLVWLGTLFVPLLPFINIIKLIVIMYIRGWAVMTCNVPARQIFRASRSNNFYLILLLVMFLVSTIPVFYVIASIRPSRSCGPFAGQDKFYDVIVYALRNNLNKNVVTGIETIMSPGIIVPLLLFLILVIYFMVSLNRGLRDANHELTEQLMVERTEEKKRIFELAGGGRRKQNGLHKTSSERSAVSPLGDRLSVKSSQSPSKFEDAKEKHSTSKSPTRAPFLPSLQSVHEDEDEDEPNQNKQLLPRTSQSSNEHTEHRPDFELLPVKYTWKQKLKLWIGLETKDRLDAQIRMRQLATAYQERQEREKSVEQQDETPADSDESRRNHPQIHEVLEEASSSNEEYSEEPSTNSRARGPTPRGGTPGVRGPRRSPWSRDDDQNDVTVIREPSLPNFSPTQLYPRPGTSRPSSRPPSTTPQRTPTRTPTRTPVQKPNYLDAPETLTRRSHSMNDQRIPFERDLASEASPLLDRRAENVREAEQHRLTPLKRSPPSVLPRKQSNPTSYEYSLDRTPALYHGQKVFQMPEDNMWDSDLNGRLMASSDDPTRPPSEEASFRDPTPSVHEQPISPTSPSVFELPEDLLTYANPYSSYAAAMCSPVMAERMMSDIYQPTPPPMSSPTPFCPNYYPPLDPYGYRPTPSYRYNTPASHSRTPVSAGPSRQPSVRPSRPSSAQPHGSTPFTPPPVMENYPMYSHTYSPQRALISPPVQRDVYSPRDLENRLTDNSSPSGGYASGSPTMSKPRFRISSSPPQRRGLNYASEQDSGRGSGSGGDGTMRKTDQSMRQRTLMGQHYAAASGSTATTDDSTSPERSPVRQPGSTHQTTV